MAYEKGQPDTSDSKEQSGKTKNARGIGFYIVVGLIVALGATVAWEIGYTTKYQRFTICYDAMEEPVYSNQPNYKENLIEVQRSCHGEIVEATDPNIQFFLVAKNSSTQNKPLAKYRENYFFEVGALAALLSAPLLAFLMGFGNKISGRWRRLGQYGAWTIISMGLWYLFARTFFSEIVGHRHAYTKFAQLDNAECTGTSYFLWTICTIVASSALRKSGSSIHVTRRSAPILRPCRMSSRTTSAQQLSRSMLVG